MPALAETACLALLTLMVFAIRLLVIVDFLIMVLYLGGLLFIGIDSQFIPAMIRRALACIALLAATLLPIWLALWSKSGALLALGSLAMVPITITTARLVARSVRDCALAAAPLARSRRRRD